MIFSSHGWVHIKGSGNKHFPLVFRRSIKMSIKPWSFDNLPKSKAQASQPINPALPIERRSGLANSISKLSLLCASKSKACYFGGTCSQIMSRFLWWKTFEKITVSRRLIFNSSFIVFPARPMIAGSDDWDLLGPPRYLGKASPQAALDHL